MPPSDARYFEHNPWEFWTGADADARECQHELQATLVRTQGMSIGHQCYIAESAVVYCDGLSLGDRSFIAACAQVMGDISIGADSSVNPYTDIRGDVTIGNGVRIGAHTSILGFNHLMEPDRPVFQQDVESRGIRVGDDVWIGSRVVIVDGVSVGNHVIIGAGSIVTHDVADWAIVGGNPARLIRDRRSRRRGGSDDLDRRAAGAAVRLMDALPDLLSQHRDADSRAFVNRAGVEPDPRALCDAIELSVMLRSETPLGIAKADLVDMLAGMQDSGTGLVLDPMEVEMLPHAPMPNLRSAYNTLCVGYALGALGAHFSHPLHTILDVAPSTLVNALDDMPWSARAWEVGAWIDTVGSALAWSRPHRSAEALTATMFGWLVVNCDPATGMWGTQQGADSLQAVNGFYRLTRGTYAEFGLPVPFPTAAIDTALAHAGDGRYFGKTRGNACNVLDATHVLWLASRQVDYRRAAIQAWARGQLDRLLDASQTGGYSFDLERGDSPSSTPSLEGTEMWTSIMWYLCDLLGFSEALGYVPCGIHKPEPIGGDA